MILALDTATRTASLALHDGQQVWAEETWRQEQRHTVELLPRIDRAVRAAGLRPADITAVVVALGPGSYTGLRVGLSLAKGLCAAGALPLVGIPTLHVAAFPHQWQPRPVCAVLEAGRGRWCWAFYEGAGAAWQPLGDFRLGRLDELAASVSVPTYLVGELDETARAALQARMGDLACIASPAAALRRAGHLAELGQRRLARGDTDDVATLSPIYLREP